MSGFMLGVLVALLVSCMIAFKKSYFHLDEGHLGVLTSFGKALKDEQKQLRLFEPGLHSKKPWQKVVIVSMMETVLDLTGESYGRTAMAEDGTILRLDSKLRLTTIREALYHYLFDLKKPLEHITGLFTCLLRNEIANFGDYPESGSYAKIRSERKLLNQRIDIFCRNEIENRYGVQFRAVDLTDILPPDELAEALNAVINAESEAQAFLSRAEADCTSRVMKAEKGISIAKARAFAVYEEIVTFQQYLESLDQEGLLDAYVERRKAEVYAESRTHYLNIQSPEVSL